MDKTSQELPISINASIVALGHINEQASTVALTDDLVQSLFFTENQNRFRFNAFEKEWMMYDAGLWRSCLQAGEQNSLSQYMRRNLKDLIDKYGPKDQEGAWTGESYRLFTRYKSASGQNGILRLATHTTENHINPAQFDRDRHLLNTPTFVIDLKTGQKLLHDPGYQMTRRTRVAPCRSPTPVFERFLSDFTQGDTELGGFLQRWLGLCLTGETREHKVAFLCGPGGNGKSLLLNAVRDIFGSYVKTANAQILLQGAENRHTADVADLVGARLVVINELPSDGMWSQQRLTSLTGGDTLSARRMYGNPFEFEPQFKLMLSGNQRPVVQDSGDAFQRRMLFVGSTFRPTVPDTELPDKIRAEYGGILQWMIDGAVAYYADGLQIPEGIRAATLEYAADEDDVGQWLEERCIRNSGAFAPTKSLYESYKGWAEDNGSREYKKRALSEKLKSRGFISDKRNGQRGWKGLELKPEVSNFGCCRSAANDAEQINVKPDISLH